MYIGIYIIYRVYMSEACDLAQLRCGATMARLICVARSSHMWPGPGNVWLSLADAQRVLNSVQDTFGVVHTSYAKTHNPKCHWEDPGGLKKKRVG
jgi:hypothetical protein